MKVIIISGLLVILLLQGCNFNTSIKKDLISGAVYTAHGLDSDNVEMEVNGKPSKKNTFTYGDKVEFTFNNIKGLKRKKGKVYPGMSMHIINNAGDTVLQLENLFKDDNDGTDLNPLLLRAFFKAALPHLNKEKYKVILKIWDKNSPGTITYTMPFEVVKSEFLSIQSNEIDYSNIYFWNDTDKKVVTDKKLDANSTYILIAEGLVGLDLIDDRVYPGIELEIIDNNGEYILSEANMLESLSEFGVERNELAENQVPVTIIFSPGKIANPCRLKAKIKDLKNSSKNIVIEADIIIE